MKSNNLNKINELLVDSYTSRTKDINTSISLGKEALRLSEEIDNKALIGKSLNRLALFYMIASDFKKSNELSENAIAIFKSINVASGIADAKYTIGTVFYKTNDFYSGLIHLLEALKIYRSEEDLLNQARVKKAIATIYEYIGDNKNALKTYLKAISLAKKVSDKKLESNILNNLSGLFLKRNKQALAEKTINYSIYLKKKTGDIRGLGFAIYGRGKTHQAAGLYEEAEKDFIEAIKIHVEVKEYLGTAMALNKLGKLYFIIKDYDKALEKLNQGLDIALRVDSVMVKLKSYDLFYLLYKSIGNSMESLKYLELYMVERATLAQTQTLKVIEHHELINQMNNLENETRINKAKQKAKQKAINRSNQEARKAIIMQQEFLSIMSHEIRTPLNAITTITSLLEENVKEDDKKLFNSLKFASSNLIEIVNDILDFTKLESNKAVIDEESSDFSKLCTNVIYLHRHEAERKGLSIAFENKVPFDRIYLIDQSKMTQVLGNLINNAIKFTDNGGIVLTTELISGDEVYDTVRVSVADTGEGISKKNLKVIFNTFAHVKPVKIRDQGGTGLGLPIVKRLVELFGSEILVESEVNEGSEFYFTLKLKKSLKVTVEEEFDFSKISGKTVLIAEDNLINAFLLKKILSKWAVNSAHVKDGEAAFEASKLKEYDYILMDIHMPVMNGIEASKLIKNTENPNINTPIIAVTADVLVREDKANEALFNSVLCKPLEIDKLYLALSENVGVKEF